MEHYFIAKEHDIKDYFKFDAFFSNKKYVINSCSDIFSKNNIDYGTRVLIETILKKENLFGQVLDLGCGYGIIGMVIAKEYANTVLTFADVNKTAVELTKKNVLDNNINNISDVIESDLFENIHSKFDFIITNPPIRTGKENLKRLVWQSYVALNNGGSLFLVIKKKHGEESIKKILEEKFAVEILEREKGYYILKATK